MILLGFILAGIITIYFATYFLIPLPLLSYQQGKLETYQGVMTEVKKIRPGVIKVSVKQDLLIDESIRSLGFDSFSSSVTYFFYLRTWQKIPRQGDRVSITHVNRFHHFTGSSFNWVKKWEIFTGIFQPAGRVSLVSEGN